MSIAWLFPGQGSQSVGMATDLLAASPAARAVVERVDRALGQPLSQLMANGPEAELTVTANAQPAILATSCAVLAALRERWPDFPLPTYAAGHSLGEYSALVAAGAMELEDAAVLVRARGRAMQEAVPSGTGAMSAVMGIDLARLEAFCAEAAQGEVVSPANFNAPGQIVISGHSGAVARVGQLVVANNGRAIPLKVSAPFHCRLMAPAARVVAAELDRISLRSPLFPVVANFDALPNRESARIRELLVRQVDGVVRWEESVLAMASGGVTHALEIGPGKVLSGLVKRITKAIRVVGVGGVASFDEAGALLEGAGRP